MSFTTLTMLHYNRQFLLIPYVYSIQQTPSSSTVIIIALIVFILLIAGIGLVFYLTQASKTKEPTNQLKLEEELKKLRIAKKQGDLIAKMAGILSTTLDYREVLDKMIELGLPAMGISSAKSEDAEEQKTVGLALLFERSETELPIVAGRNMARSDEGRMVSAEVGLIHETVQNAESTISNNIKEDKTLNSIVSLRRCNSALCAPLRVGFDTYGVVLFATTKANFYTENHKKLLSTLCSQVVIPLENAQLVEELRREQQKILAKEEEARRKLARDLHDGPTQSVAAIAMRLNFIKMLIKNKEFDKAFDEIIKVEEIGQRAVKEIRTMLFTMRPVVLETKGLAPALEGYAERLNAVESFKILFVNKGYNGQLKTETEGVLFAIVEEAVGNAKKHAKSTEVKILLEVQQKNLLLEIKDNGMGFDVAKTRASYDQRSSLGMINLFERSEAIGGHCEIDSAVGKGTAVKINVPL